MNNTRGSAMLLALTVLAIMTIGVSALLGWFNATFDYTAGQEARQVCAHVAEAGLDTALAELRSGNRAYAGETGTPVGDGTFSVTVAPAQRPGWLAVESTGLLPRGAKFVQVRLCEEVLLDGSGGVAGLEWREVRHD